MTTQINRLQHLIIFNRDVMPDMTKRLYDQMRDVLYGEHKTKSAYHKKVNKFKSELQSLERFYKSLSKGGLTEEAKIIEILHKNVKEQYMGFMENRNNA